MSILIADVKDIDLCDLTDADVYFKLPESWKRDCDKHINIFLELGHTESIKSLLMNHECLTCISKIAVTSEVESKKLIQVPLRNFECKRNFYMIYHKDKYRSELFEKFVSFTQKMMQEMIDERS